MRGHESKQGLNKRIINISSLIGPTFTIRSNVFTSYINIHKTDKTWVNLISGIRGEATEIPILLSPGERTANRLAISSRLRNEQREHIKTTLGSNLFEFILISRDKKIFLETYNVKLLSYIPT